MDEPSVSDAAKAVGHAQQALIAEYRAQLLEARGHAMVLARKLGESQAREVVIARELEYARRELFRQLDELARKDARIVELEQQLELAAWREKLGPL